MFIGEYCKQYRIKKGVRLVDFSPNNYKAISAFENGRSTNINHFFKYMKLAIENGEVNDFLKGLRGVE